MGLRGIREELPHLFTLHHAFCLFLTIVFYITKVVGPICHLIYGNEVRCKIDNREYEILLLLCVVIFVKNRRATSWLHYVSTMFTFSKVANLILFYRMDPLWAIVYAVLCLLQIVLLPEPAYSGPESIVYFRGPNLWNEIERDKRIIWLIEFYTTWSPDCSLIQKTFAELSNKYSLENLKFAKLDVGRYSQEAERFRINVHPTSRQLPTLSLFENGKETIRRPSIDRHGRAIRYVFSSENIITDFGLNQLYQDCLQNLPKKKGPAAKKED